jgi:hypothetical protein
MTWSNSFPEIEMIDYTGQNESWGKHKKRGIGVVSERLRVKTGGEITYTMVKTL